jgi:hypothetical protein
MNPYLKEEHLLKQNILISIIPLTYMLMLKPNLSYFHYVTYFLIALIAVIIIIYSSKLFGLTQSLINFLLLLGLCSFTIAISVLLNLSNLSIMALFEVFKPIYFSFILLSGYFVGLYLNYNKICKGLLTLAYIVILFQCILAIDQLWNLQILSNLYYSDKTKSLGSLIRITGTIGNPNTFAWIVTQMSILIFLLETKKGLRLFFLTIGFVLVLLSGSRSAFLLFPFMIFTSKLLSNRNTVKFYLIKLPLYTALLVGILMISYQLLIKYGSELKYLYQIVSVIEDKSFTSINSFDARTQIWNHAWQNFTSENNMLITWLFGLGPGSLSSLDNDYLFAAFNNGLIFFIINIFIYMYILIRFMKVKNLKIKALGVQYIIFSFIIGFQAETLSGWNYPILIFFYFGLALSLNREQVINNKLGNVIESNRK